MFTLHNEILSLPALKSDDISDQTAGKEDIYSTDPGCWPAVIDTHRQNYWIGKGPVPCQNRSRDCSTSEKQYKHQKRAFSKSFFSRKLLNGESGPRDWLIYSPTKGSVFCFACKLFGVISLFSGLSGYSDWKHSHRECMVTWGSRTSEKGQIDASLRDQFRLECQYWEDIAERSCSYNKIFG